MQKRSSIQIQIKVVLTRYILVPFRKLVYSEVMWYFQNTKFNLTICVLKTVLTLGKEKLRLVIISLLSLPCNINLCLFYKKSLIASFHLLLLFSLQAKLINFNPLSTVDVKLPSSVTFVIAHSGVEINKAATSDFNLRVVECRIAAQVRTVHCNICYCPQRHGHKQGSYLLLQQHTQESNKFIMKHW